MISTFTPEELAYTLSHTLRGGSSWNRLGELLEVAGSVAVRDAVSAIVRIDMLRRRLVVCDYRVDISETTRAVVRHAGCTAWLAGIGCPIRHVTWRTAAAAYTVVCHVPTDGNTMSVNVYGHEIDNYRFRALRVVRPLVRRMFSIEVRKVTWTGGVATVAGVEEIP